MHHRSFEKRKVWDPITRTWHWLLAAMVSINWCLGEFMDFDTVSWHMYLGYGILGLLAFRVIWGVWGSASARFSSLKLSFSEIRNYLRTFLSRSPSGEDGHSPFGSLSVAAMLAALCVQAVSGLFIESEEFFEYGPLAEYVSDSTIGWMVFLHHFTAKVILFLVGLHLSAILFYRLWKHEDLLTPMINGWKWVKRNKPGES